MEPEPTWRSMYEEERVLRLQLQKMLDSAELQCTKKTIEYYNLKSKYECLQNSYKEQMWKIV